MTTYSSYPFFVADQVLMADHLNEIVEYLDVQERLTRNRLIGIGIVCGLELRVTPSKIDISKGCGVTSEGYLITLEDSSYTHYKPYAISELIQPNEAEKDYSFYSKWKSWQL